RMDTDQWVLAWTRSRQLACRRIRRGGGGTRWWGWRRTWGPLCRTRPSSGITSSARRPRGGGQGTRVVGDVGVQLGACACLALGVGQFGVAAVCIDRKSVV